MSKRNIWELEGEEEDVVIDWIQTFCLLGLAVVCIIIGVIVNG